MLSVPCMTRLPAGARRVRSGARACRWERRAVAEPRGLRSGFVLPPPRARIPRTAGTSRIVPATHSGDTRESCTPPARPREHRPGTTETALSSDLEPLREPGLQPFPDRVIQPTPRALRKRDRRGDFGATIRRQDRPHARSTDCRTSRRRRSRTPDARFNCKAVNEKVTDPPAAVRVQPLRRLHPAGSLRTRPGSSRLGAAPAAPVGEPRDLRPGERSRPRERNRSPFSCSTP